jgi:Acylphosphatase
MAACKTCSSATRCAAKRIIWRSQAGWNRSDGTVEAAVHAEPADVDAIVRWAQHDLQQAQVERVDIEPDDDSYTRFKVIGQS